jgi:EF-P beta-lysylation protein EpmB
MIPKSRAAQGIAVTGTSWQGLDDSVPPPAWRRELAGAVTDPAQLLRLLALPEELLGPAAAAARRFPLRVPRGFVARMRPGDPHDPLLRQVLPLGAELAEVAGYGGDPVGDLHAAARPGVLHKYRGRALLMVAGGCAVNCRYCFRREFPYAEHQLAGAARAEALAYLAADSSITEVILSGGDPLLLGDDRLAALAAELAAIPHLRRLRVHTRVPVVLPARVDDALLGWLAGGRLRPVMVIHANHPREIDAAVASAMERLRAVGVTLLNQAVLLAGVNDSAEVLAELSEVLFEAGVMPYYLHLLDRVRGAAHFEVGQEQARQLVAALTARLPGYLVPRLVRERAGAAAKLPVDLRLDG